MTQNIFFKSGKIEIATPDHARRTIMALSAQYERKGIAFIGSVEVTDVMYDRLYRAYREWNPEDSIFKIPTPSGVKGSDGTIVCDPPMTSISKAGGKGRETTVARWLRVVANKLGVDVSELQLSISFKFDGIAARAVYKRGVLVSLCKRPPDGINAVDITRHAPFIRNLPISLPGPFSFAVNFELCCKRNDFSAINKFMRDHERPEYKNPRNYTAGKLSRDETLTENSHIHALALNIVNFENEERYFTDQRGQELFLCNLGFTTPLSTRHSSFGILDLLAACESNADAQPEYIDGVVITLYHRKEREALGHVADNPCNDPLHSLAWKFKEVEQWGTVKEMEWNVSRNGRVIPVAILEEPLNLADTDVSRATAHNYSWAKDRDLGVGSSISVIKSGKIIPKIIDVDNGENANLFAAPTDCPECSRRLCAIKNGPDGSTDLKCDNPFCKGQVIEKIVFFMQKIGCKNIGRATVEELYNADLVESWWDMFKLKLISTVDATTLTKKQVLNLLRDIWQLPNDTEKTMIRVIKRRKKHKGEDGIDWALKVQAADFIAACGIDGVQKSTANAMLKKFGSVAGIYNASYIQLQTVKGIGEITCHSVYSSGLGVWYNVALEFMDIVDPIDLEDTKFAGNRFVLSGKFEGGKKKLQEYIESQGGMIATSVTDGTFAVVNDDGKITGKVTKAKEKGVAIISSAQVRAM